jgi:hypothetical protein
MIEINGKPIQDGQTVTVDHTVHTFTIQICSMGIVDADVLKRLIQQKYEVIDIAKTDETSYVRASETTD